MFLVKTKDQKFKTLTYNLINLARIDIEQIWNKLKK